MKACLLLKAKNYNYVLKSWLLLRNSSNWREVLWLPLSYMWPSKPTAVAEHFSSFDSSKRFPTRPAFNHPFAHSSETITIHKSQTAHPWKSLREQFTVQCFAQGRGAGTQTTELLMSGLRLQKKSHQRRVACVFTVWAVVRLQINSS